MSASDREREKATQEERLRIHQQIAFASGLFQGDITIRTLLESLAEGVVIIDRSGTILLVNSYAEKMFGYAVQELIGQPHAVLIPERFRKIHQEHQAHFFAAPKTRPMGQFLDLVGCRKDGSEFPVEICLSFIETINGVLVMAFISDITLRKQYEVHLQESEQRFGAFMLHLPAAAWIKDLDGKYVYANAEAERIFARRLPDLQGRTDAEIFPAETARRFRENDSRVLLECAPLQTVEVLQQANHAEHFSLVNKFPVPGPDGKAAFVAGVAFDISDLMRAKEEITRLHAELSARAAELEAANQKLEIANQELEAFNYTVAHDLRQPLNSLAIYCQTIDALCGDQLQGECASYVLKSYMTTLQMSRLIDALFNFSHTGHVELHPKRIDLSAIASEVVEDLEPADSGRQFEFRIAGGIAANADADLMRVVLDNLLRNAWKYTGQRDKAVIEFDVTEIDGKPAYYVRDNGAGFNMTDAEKLFTPFHRLPGAEAYKGSGVGLATVGRVIQRHGGKVWAVSELGKGTTVYFTLAGEDGCNSASNGMDAAQT